MKSHLAKTLALAGIACIAQSAFCGETFTFGKWSLDGKSFALSYGERCLTEGVDVGYWSKNYAQSLSMGKWTAQTLSNGVAFVRESAGVKSVLSFSFNGTSARQSLALDIRQVPGPLEYAIRMRPERYAVSNDRSILRHDGVYTEITSEPLAGFGAKEFAWETVEASFVHRSLNDGRGFRFQDLRQKGSDILRYIHCSVVDAPSQLKFENVWTVNEGYDAASQAARRARFERSLSVGDAVAVDNAGFESGCDKWSLADTARLDDRNAHTGSRSVRMDIEKPERDHVYVTRQIPVTAGSQYRVSCWVKTCGVAEAADAKLEQDGASVIVEWADAHGKWFQGGVNSRKLWGTNDWTNLRLKCVTAPPKAGFAIVFLSLRAKGTAWFDDLTVEKLKYPVCKLMPAEGADATGNTPLFAWRPVPGWRRYQLMLSQKLDFPAEATQCYAVGGIPEFRLEQPLERGTWYWKVVTDGMDDALPSVLTVAVSPDADCLPPQPKTRAVRILSGDAPFSVQVRELTDETPTLAVRFGKLIQRGECVERRADHLLTYRFAAPAGGWPRGFSEGQLAASDRAGNRERRPFYLLNAPKPANDVVVDAQGYMRENGQRIFPFGIYEVNPEYMQDVRTTKFDAVHLYRWEDNHDDVGCRRYLDQCWKTSGLRAFIGFDRGNGTNDGLVQGNFAHVARRTGALADHPGLFCWYLFDEPELINQFVAPDLLIAYADLVRALDPYHPVVMSTWNPTMIEFRRSWDTHWTQAYGNPKETLRRLEQERGFVNGDSPFTLLINCNDQKQSAGVRKGIKPDPERFFPDTDYLRACAFISVVRECNGLWWWWFARGCGFYYTVADSPKAWAGVGQILSEIDALRPIITADARPVYGIANSGDASVAWWMKTVDGVTTFLAVNVSEKPVEVDIDLPGFGRRHFAFGRYEVKNEKL